MPDYSQENPPKFENLDETQRSIVRAIGENDAVWVFGNSGNTLRFFGLPTRGDELRAFAGLPDEPEPSLDEKIKRLQARITT